VQAFARVSPEACILTKVDEAASLGGVLSATIRHKLKIAYICDGQRVPEDMHAAQERRIWLVRAALQMKQASRGSGTKPIWPHLRPSTRAWVTSDSHPIG
jgi:flagellar biosynthesis protein FlhF